MIRYRGYLLTLAAALAVFSACETSKSSNPLSPSVAGPIPGVNITAPKLLEPGVGWSISVNQQPVTLLLENASSTGPRPLTYMIELSADQSFSNKLFVRDGVAQGDKGRTSFTLPEMLAPGHVYFWRAQAQDGANAGPVALAASFEVFMPIAIEAPGATSPAGGTRITGFRPTLVARNANRTGPAGALTYTFQLSTHEGFGTMVAIVTTPEQPNETRVTLGQDLEYERAYYWRVRAYDSSTTGPWSATQLFHGPMIPPTFTLAGIVRNASTGAPVANVRVQVMDGVNAGKSATTDGNGYYNISGLNESSFTLRASKDGYFLSDRGMTISGNLQLDLTLTPVPVAPPPAPTPTPTPTPPSNPTPTPTPGGGNCVGSSPLSIVECERSKFGFMSSSQLVQFLFSVAKSLNRNGIGGGPFGVLRKSGGHQCNGYSCDVVCSGQGGGQRQWDVLSDAESAQLPVWSGPLGNIRVDVCEIP